MIKVFGYGSSCQSTRKARRWLKEHDIPYAYRNVYSVPFSIEEIRDILQLTEKGTEDIISTRTDTFKELDLDVDQLSLSALYDYIQKYPKLLRFPIIMDENKLQVGFNKHDIRQFIPKEDRRKSFLELFTLPPKPEPQE